MSKAFNGTVPNLNYAVNRLNRSYSILDKLVNTINATVKTVTDTVGGLVNGSGSTASNDKVEAAVQWAVNKATNNYITYSQTNRNLKNVNATSYDCSSFIITAFYAAGIDVNATYTGNMIAGFTAAGFVWHAGNPLPASSLKRGDILLNIKMHTQMYIGDNQDVNCGSTPAKVLTHSTNYWGKGWDGYLRYEGN